MAAAPKTFTVERTTTINATPGDIYAHVNDFHQWRGWSPWEDADPQLQRTYSGPDAGVGATYAWVGNRKAGSGSMEITGNDEPSTITIALKFLKPFKAENAVVFTFTPQSDGTGTHVRWTMTGVQNILSRIMGVFFSMDKIVGKDFEKGLAQLKARCE